MSSELTTKTPMDLISAQLDRGTSVADLTKLFDLQERWEKSNAAKKFAEAIRCFQAECPPIVRDKGIPDKNGNTKYKYAPYEDIMGIIQPLLTKLEIVPTFSFVWKDKMIETTCHIRVGTHVEDTTVPLGIPEIPGANDAQKTAGATSYGMRHSLKAALNIRIVGEDFDGVGLIPDERPISEQEAAVISKLVDEISMLEGAKYNLPGFCMWLTDGATNELASLPKSQFAAGVAELTRRRNVGPPRKVASNGQEK